MSKGSVPVMNQETADTQVRSFAEFHPWLAQTVPPEEDTVEEVIRYTLDEIRFS